MKKPISILLALTLVLSLAACGEKSEPIESEPVFVGIPNPVIEVTPAQLLEEVGIDLSALADYDNAAFYLIDGERKIAEVDFSLDGDAYNYRVAMPPFEEDISGMYYDWTETSEAEVGYNTAAVHLTADGVGYISWFDIVPGVMYSLSMTQNATAEKLTAAANRLYTPLQGDAVPDAENPESEGFDPFREPGVALITELQQSVFPGTAGSSLTGAAFAARLADLFTEMSPSVLSVSNAVSVVRSMLSEDETAVFADQISFVIGCYENLIANGTDILADAGYTPTACPWEDQDVAPLMKGMYPAAKGIELADRAEEYYEAVQNQLSVELLMDQDLCYLCADSTGTLNLDTVGYAITDLDGDGRDELVIGTIADNDFLGKLVLDLYTMNEYGFIARVFSSAERNRWYSAGGDLFVHVGSGSAFDSFETVEQYANGVMTETGAETPEYVQLELTPLSALHA